MSANISKYSSAIQSGRVAIAMPYGFVDATLFHIAFKIIKSQIGITKSFDNKGMKFFRLYLGPM